MTQQFTPLATDYTVDWDAPTSPLSEGEHYDHGFIALPNGYAISVLRMRGLEHGYFRKDFTTVGFDEGQWEVGIGQTHGPLAQMLGMTMEPPWSLEETLNADILGPRVQDDDPFVYGPFDSAGVNSVIAYVAALPSPNPVQDEQALASLFDVEVGE